VNEKQHCFLSLINNFYQQNAACRYKKIDTTLVASIFLRFGWLLRQVACVKVYARVRRVGWYLQALNSLSDRREKWLNDAACTEAERIIN